MNDNFPVLKPNCFIRGEPGPTGPTGPQGENGLSETISIGNVSTTESINDAQIIDNKSGGDHVLDFVIPKGPKGDPGPLSIPTAVFVKLNENSSGEEVKSEKSIPLTMKIGDDANQFILNKSDRTITFVNKGTYYVDFIVQAHPIDSSPLKDDHDMVAIGLVKSGNNAVYVGGSTWSYDKATVNVIGKGIVELPYDNIQLELVNLGKYSIYLDNPPGAYTYTSSSLINPVVTLTIQRIK